MLPFFPEKIKQFCIGAGFDLVGFSKAIVPENTKEYIRRWVAQGRHGKMNWFFKDVSMEIRLDLKHLGFTPKSVICLGLIYNSEEAEFISKRMKTKVSRYAFGDDYHAIIRKKAKPILSYLRKEYPSYHFRQSVDSLPIPEKVFAKLAGLGWIGKNTNLIHPDLGSYFFISTILTDCAWDITEYPSYDHCGTCRACLDACPTNALSPYEIDASKCISHHTIENRDSQFDEETKIDEWVYGCDICQEVCPWNQIKARRNMVYTKTEDFLPKGIFSHLGLSALGETEEAEFLNQFSKSSIKRIGVNIWNRNILKWNKDHE